MHKTEVVKKENYFMNKTSKKAFTLAEMVISLAILGILAALTIPTFFVGGTSQKNQYVNALRKLYTDFDFATQQIKSNNSGVMENAWSTTGNANDNLRNLYSRFLKITQLCNAGAAHTNCWSANYYKFNGGANGLDLSTYSMAVLNDGSMLAFKALSTACTDSTVKDAASNNIACAEVDVDVNGFNKPNRFGVDIFRFFIVKVVDPTNTNRDINSKIIFNGDIGTKNTATSYYGANDCPLNAYNGGLECAAKALQDGKMLY